MGAAPIGAASINPRLAREHTMQRIVIAVAAVAFLFGAGVASAGDVKGVIKSINGNTRTVTIDGVAYYFPQTVDMGGLTAGQTVTITFDTANGRNQVSKVAK